MEDQKRTTSLTLEIDNYSEKDSSAKFLTRFSEPELHNLTERKEAGFKLECLKEKHEEIKKPTVDDIGVQQCELSFREIIVELSRETKLLVAEMKKATTVQEGDLSIKEIVAELNKDTKSMLAELKKDTKAVRDWLGGVVHSCKIRVGFADVGKPKID
ncbi:unnamed protein product [Microthlaspi erraticum]|uniref:Uncharacterized protein n=1 Tax=Microthlaspi erraticum TaxID=1685480 RepID=A0A6D2JKL9_9BRAS|nr:unnamed protein product [Microthlaspi erraticum]CAA7040265.1 unnamed protein product [Microthlaspi erraticum]